MRARVRRYSTREVARALGLSNETVRREIRRGHLHAEPSGYGRYQVVYETDLDLWINSNQAKTVLARSLHYYRRSNKAIPRSSNQPDTDTTDDE